MELKRRGIVLEPKADIGAIFNCGAIEYEDSIYLLPRVIKKGYTKKKSGGYDNYISEIWLAKSSDGKKFMLSDTPLIKPDKPYDLYGCEDPRVTKLYDEYFITYTALLGPAFSGGNRMGLASTKDFSQTQKHGITGPDLNDKDVVIFPEEVKGKIGVLHRVEPNIQIMYFDDIEQLKKNHDKKFWEKYMSEIDKYIVLDRKYDWELSKVGAGPPPIKTREGWLLIYHGVDKKGYKAAAALLDLDNPQKVIARSPKPILKPKKRYERIGDVNKVVFPEGAVVKEEELLVYYGAADKRCALATCKLDDLIDFLLKNKV
ncbi:MAG: glycosidase [Nanoarchaeota archaeon]|nr:glycosidase [Nanoarchaeota archaeon]